MHPLCRLALFWSKKHRKAEIAQLVERNLAKVKVAGSRPVFRSKMALFGLFFFHAWVVELVDTQDLKSCVFTDVRVQVPSRVQGLLRNERPFFIMFYAVQFFTQSFSFLASICSKIILFYFSDRTFLLGYRISA